MDSQINTTMYSDCTEVEFASFLYGEFTSSSTGQKTGKLQLCGLIKQSGPRQRGNQMVATSVLSRVKLTL